MANLEVRIRTDVMLPQDALPIGEIPLKLDVIQRTTDLLIDVGGNLFDVDISDDRIEWTYQLGEDGTRVFMDVVVDVSRVTA